LVENKADCFVVMGMGFGGLSIVTSTPVGDDGARPEVGWVALSITEGEPDGSIDRPQPEFNPGALRSSPLQREIRLMMTEIEVRREIYHLITESRKGYTLAGPRIVNDEDADELSWRLFYGLKAKDLLKMEKVDDDR
jgi:hypothetical protein